MKRLTTVWLLVLLLIATSLPGCASGETSQTTSQNDQVFKLAMIFDSPVAEDGFSLGCLRGAEKAKSEYGIGLTFCEARTPEEVDYLLGQLTESQRYQLIICIGYSQAATIQKYSEKYPKQNFALVDGDIKDRSNVASLLSRDEESSYLVGALAALVSKTGKIGFIGGIDQPSIQRFLAGYRAGAQHENSGIQVLTGFSGNWVNDGKTYDLALEQSKQGADVFFGAAGGGNLGVIKVAEENGLYAMGVDTDQSYLAPKNVPASTLKNVAISVFECIKMAVSGNFRGGVVSTGLKEGGADIALNEAFPGLTNNMRLEIEIIKKQIISGQIKVPEK